MRVCDSRGVVVSDVGVNRDHRVCAAQENGATAVSEAGAALALGRIRGDLDELIPVLVLACDPSPASHRLHLQGSARWRDEWLCAR